MKQSTFAGLLGAVCLAGHLCAQTAQSGLATQEIKNVDATSDATVNASLPALPPAFRLTGTIGGSATAFFLSVTAQSVNGSASFSGSVNPITKMYLVMVPADTYMVSVAYVDSRAATPSLSTFLDPAQVQVTGDTVHDITVAPVVTHTVSGVISGLDSRLPSTILVFAPSNQANISLSSANDAKLNADGSYSVQLSDASWQVLLASSTADNSEFTSTGLGSVTVSGADVVANFTAPPFADVSGTVQMADSSPVPAGSTVIGIEGNPFTLVSTTTGFPLFSFGSGSIDSTSGAYALYLATGHTYTLGVNLQTPPEAPPQSSGDFAFLVTGPTQLTGDTTQNITAPPIPGTSTISGQVTGPNGAPLAMVSVDATTTQLNGVPMSGFSRSTTTDPNGNYSLVVLSGTNYDMVFTPPYAGAGSMSNKSDTRRSRNRTRMLQGIVASQAARASK